MTRPPMTSGRVEFHAIRNTVLFFPIRRSNDTRHACALRRRIGKKSTVFRIADGQGTNDTHSAFVVLNPAPHGPDVSR